MISINLIPYYHLFSRNFNFTNLEWKYFAGIKFLSFDESLFFKVNKFRESNTVHYSIALFLTSISMFYLTVTD